MKVDVFNLRNDFINTIENVNKIVECKDGRYLITSNKKSEQDEMFTTQVPAGYRITVKTNE